ncbi:collagen triple helix repeat protein [Saudi moumouvirus]|nr:collagen triple helix repeat protein [Saudi moumouvirus]
MQSNGVITGGTITIVAAATQSNTLTYPFYCWIGIFRIDYSQRELMGVLEFAITTPTSGGAVGTANNIGVRLLATNTSTSTDGRYNANRVLNKTAPSVLTEGNIPFQYGWLVGAELFGSQSASGGANTITFVQELNGSFAYAWGRPFAQSISGYRNVILTLNVS